MADARRPESIASLRLRASRQGIPLRRGMKRGDITAAIRTRQLLGRDLPARPVSVDRLYADHVALQRAAGDIPLTPDAFQNRLAQVNAHFTKSGKVRMADAQKSGGKAKKSSGAAKAAAAAKVKPAAEAAKATKTAKPRKAKFLDNRQIAADAKSWVHKDAKTTKPRKAPGKASSVVPAKGGGDLASRYARALDKSMSIKDGYARLAKVIDIMEADKRVSPAVAKEVVQSVMKGGNGGTSKTKSLGLLRRVQRDLSTGAAKLNYGVPIGRGDAGRIATPDELRLVAERQQRAKFRASPKGAGSKKLSVRKAAKVDKPAAKAIDASVDVVAKIGKPTLLWDNSVKAVEAAEGGALRKGAGKLAKIAGKVLKPLGLGVSLAVAYDAYDNAAQAGDSETVATAKAVATGVDDFVLLGIGKASIDGIAANAKYEKSRYARAIARVPEKEYAFGQAPNPHMIAKANQDAARQMVTDEVAAEAAQFAGGGRDHAASRKASDSALVAAGKAAMAKPVADQAALAKPAGAGAYLNAAAASKALSPREMMAANLSKPSKPTAKEQPKAGSRIWVEGYNRGSGKIIGYWRANPHR